MGATESVIVRTQDLRSILAVKTFHYHRRVDVNAPLFISYSRKDYYFAESLAFHLLKSGVSVWFDAKDLSPGEFWKRDLETALDRASCLILVASAHSLKSPHVRSEWERARTQRKRIVIVGPQHFSFVVSRGTSGRSESKLKSRRL